MTDLRTAAQQALEAICSAKLCEFNSMSSRREMVRLMDEAITALRDALTQQAAQAELERLRAENAALKRDLQYARDGLTKGRTRMREDNERLIRERDALREVARRMVVGIDHLDKLTREWEPDHSSGADRRGWLLAKDARDDAARLLWPNVRAKQP